MDALRARLAEVDGSEAHVVGISKAALVLPKSEYGTFAKAWLEVLQQRQEKMLEYMYVANDVVQKAKAKKLPGLADEFALVLPAAMKVMTDEEKRPKILRVLGIWEERGVYKASMIRTLKRALGRASAATSSRVLSDLFGGDADDDDEGDAAFGTRGGGGKSDDDDDDEDDEEEEEEAAGTLRGPAGQMLQRQDSTVSVNEVPVARLLSVTKAKVHALQSSAPSLEARLETAMRALEGLGPKRDDGGVSGAELDLASLSDQELEQRLEEMRGLLRESLEQDLLAKECIALEGGLITALEGRLDQTASQLETYEARTALCEDLKARLGRIKQVHPDSEAIQTEVEVEKRVRKAEPTANKKRARVGSSSSSSVASSSSGSDSGSDSDSVGGMAEDEGGIESKGATAGSGAQGASVFAIKKKRKKAKKAKKKKEEAKASERPMMYNKVLKMYVPMPAEGETEDWRDH